MKALESPLVKLGLTGLVLFAAWKWGTPEVKGMALGAAGVMLLNQIPLVRDGTSMRLVA